MILWIFFGVITKIGLVLGVISMHFRVFSYVQCTNWGYFWRLLKFQIFLLCLIFLIFFGREWTVNAGSKPTDEETNQCIPPQYTPWGYICTFILFAVFTLIFGLFTSSFVFCLLCFKFCLLKGLFPLFSIAICVFTFSFLICLLCLNFGFGFPHAISMIKRHLSTLSNLGSRQTYRQTIYSVLDYRKAVEINW